MSRTPLAVLGAALLQLAAATAVAQLGRYGTIEMASVMLMGNQQVRAELKLSKSQDSTVQKAFSDYADEAEKIMNLYRKDRGNRDKYNKLLRGQQEKLINLCLTSLSAAQSQRLRQLGLQHYGPFAVVEKNVAKELQLTPAQIKQIENYRNQAKTVMDNISAARAKAVRAIPQPKNPNDKKQVEEYRKKVMAVVNKDRDKDIRAVENAKIANEKKALAVLTAAQRAKYETMKGKPFKMR